MKKFLNQEGVIPCLLLVVSVLIILGTILVAHRWNVNTERFNTCIGGYKYKVCKELIK